MYLYFLQDRAVVLYGAHHCELLYIYNVLMFSLQWLFHVISTLMTFTLSATPKAGMFLLGIQELEINIAYNNTLKSRLQCIIISVTMCPGFSRPYMFYYMYIWMCVMHFNILIFQHDFFLAVMIGF